MNLFKNLLPLAFAAAFIVLSCKGEKDQNEDSVAAFSKLNSEFFRPDFHFTPKENWMNDPKEMFYYNSTYHLFFSVLP